MQVLDDGHSGGETKLELCECKLCYWLLDRVRNTSEYVFAIDTKAGLRIQPLSSQILRWNGGQKGIVLSTAESKMKMFPPAFGKNEFARHRARFSI